MEINWVSVLIQVFAVVVMILVVYTIYNTFMEEMPKVITDCTKYDSVPMRHEGNFMGGRKVRTTEGNHDFYEEACVEGYNIYGEFIRE